MNNYMTNICSRSICLGLLVLLIVAPQLARADKTDLTTLSLEGLMDIKVESVSKRKQKLSDSAAAIYVITADDIRRSGVSSVPEALRMAPGIHVAKIDNHDWAVTARGQNGLFANSLLVLIDGRTVYTPLFSGVYWDAQDVMLEDIDRIEVIRGPGASLWGANAVNGVINITTKSSKDTKGGLLVGGFGTEERGFGSIRYGDKIGERSSYRIYAKTFNRDESKGIDGSDSFDHWKSNQFGFRFDSNFTDDDLVLQGDIYDSQNELAIAIPSPESASLTELTQEDSDFDGGNVVGRWAHRFSSDSETKTQIYYDQAKRENQLADADIKTIDFDFQHNYAFSSSNHFAWGLGYRQIFSDITGSETVNFNPSDDSFNIFSAFAQDELSLSEQFRLVLGSKFEHNDFSGTEIQPNARVIWEPSDEHTLWVAVSRAAQTPSIARKNIKLEFGIQPGQAGLPLELILLGDKNPKATNLTAYEFGYRWEPNSKLSFDLATFMSDYSDFDTVEGPGQPELELDEHPHIELPFQFDNKGKLRSYGGELVVNYDPYRWLRAQAWYAMLIENSEVSSTSTDVSIRGTELGDPRNQFAARLSLDLGSDLELDGLLRYVGRIRNFDVDSYTELGIRLGWHATEKVEASIGVENMFHDQHAEYKANFINITPAEIERAVTGKITVKF